MTDPITYVELHTPDLDVTRLFFSQVFGWDPQPFAAPDYLVAPAGNRRGIDTGILPSQDGAPRTVPVINVARLDDAMLAVTNNGGAVAVEPFTIPGVGRGCYIVDPAGMLIGLHQNDPNA